MRSGKSSHALHLDLDEAWLRADLPPMPSLDLRAWGPRLRCTVPSKTIEAFYAGVRDHLSPFLLFGSGDFHHLSALWLRRIQEPFTLVCFDNHPDWDIRPPRWSCGGWINRALENSRLLKAAVWGCGNFEVRWPWRLLANRRALHTGRLQVFPWQERLPRQPPFPAITRETWRDEFRRFLEEAPAAAVYVSIDLDCLGRGEAATNWENGLFSADDLAWALREIRTRRPLVGGDLCGIWSAPAYARRAQGFAGWFDHPRLPDVNLEEARRIHARTLQKVWPALTNG